jgi:LCP family protein required for cell wall assembly
LVTGRGLRTFARWAFYAMCCAVAAVLLIVSSFAGKATDLVGQITRSNVDTGGPQTGAMNILLMGLESRTDYQGNILPARLLNVMHAGSVQGVKNGVGGQDTNTLILIHIFAGGKKAVGVSIPRDDLVTFPQPYYGVTRGKVDQAYGLAWAQSLGQTFGKMSSDQRYTLANEAGQAATIATVESLTGEHIDHFMEVNLAGFYELAQAFNGIEVCVKPWEGGRNLHDANSGFNQRHAGYLHLNGAQTLAFVRERDNLPQGDLDRTHRQQAVIDYVIWKLGHQGVLSDISQITSLLGVASKYVIAPSGWDLITFASEMRALTGKNLTLSTLPISYTQNGVMLNGLPQDVNIIDPTYLANYVQYEFSHEPGAKPKSPAPAKTSNVPIPPASTVTVDVYNGGSTNMLAAHVSQALVAAGYTAGAVASATAQKQTVTAATQVFYGAGASANAAKIATYFGATATALSTLPAGHVEVLLGTSSTAVPTALTPGSATATSSPTPVPTVTSSSNNGQSGGVISVKSNAPYGIPCVY